MFFLEKIVERSNKSIEQLALFSGVSSRTFRDWRREKFLAPLETLQKLSKKFDVPLPRGEVLDSYWYVKKGASRGARKRLEMYGPPGTPEGRVKGGKVSQERRREDPEKYRALGCNVAKVFKTPAHSPKLAELVGIFLGDGGLDKYQAKISLSALVDREYSYFVTDLFQSVFGVRPTLYEREDDHTITLVFSGVQFVDNLEKIGLMRGDKMLNKIKIPDWILENEEYSIACLRGLFDTDGGLYFHRKKSGIYIGWCFSSHSKPLLENVRVILRKVGLNARNEQGIKLYLYSFPSIERYVEVVGSHNQKNVDKLQNYIAQMGKKRFLQKRRGRIVV